MEKPWTMVLERLHITDGIEVKQNGKSELIEVERHTKYLIIVSWGIVTSDFTFHGSLFDSLRVGHITFYSSKNKIVILL